MLICEVRLKTQCEDNAAIDRYADRRMVSKAPQNGPKLNPYINSDLNPT